MTCSKTSWFWGEVHRLLFLTMRELHPDRAHGYSHERGAKVFQDQVAGDLLRDILAHQKIAADFTHYARAYDSGAFNRYRKTSVHMEDWRA